MPLAETILDTELEQESGSKASVTALAQKSARVPHSDTHTPASSVDATPSAHLNPLARHGAAILGLYAILISGGLWASVNLLRWFWHRLL